jgi:hypothetical protein
MARAEPVPGLVPPGGRMGEARCTTLPSPWGARKRCQAAQRPAGAVQPRSVRWSVAVLTGPRATALPGSTAATERARATAASRQRPTGGLARQHEAGGTPGRRGIRPAVTRSRLLP